MKIQGVKNFPTTLADLDRLFRGMLVEPSNDTVGPNQLKSNAVTNSKLRDSAGNSVIGRSSGSSGDPGDIVINDSQFLVNRSGNLTGATLVESDIPVTIARTGDVTTEITDSISAAIVSLKGEADPFPTYTTAAEVATALATALASGTYSPTLTNVANLDSSTGYTCQYLRVGTVVTVSGKVDVNPTAAASTQLAVSLPVASNLSASEDCSGTAFATGVAGQGAAILADAINNRAVMQWIAVDTTSQAMFFTFTYRILA